MKKIRDKRGKKWLIQLPKATISRIPTQYGIERAFLNQFHKDEIVQSFGIKLPFFAPPIWPESSFNDPLNFCFCICFECGRPIYTFGRLYLVFHIIQNAKTDKYTIYWRPRIVCCDKLGFHLSFLPLLTMVKTLLSSALKDAVKTFDDRVIIKKNECYVCEGPAPCDDEICKYLAKRLPEKQTPEEHFYNLLEHFRKQKLDLLSPLIRKKCEYPFCPREMCNVICKTCRRVGYCSKRCRRRDLESHLESGCQHYLQIFNW